MAAESHKPGSSAASQMDIEELRAQLQQVMDLQREGNLDEALKSAESIVDTIVKSNWPDCPETGAAYINLATVYQSKGDYERALPMYQHGTEICEKVMGAEDPGTGIAVGNFGMLLRAMGKLGEAEPLLERALAIIETALGPDDPNTATALNNRATGYEDAGKYAAAEPLYQRASAIREKVFGPDHPETAVIINNLGCLYVKMGSYPKAEPLLRRALSIREKTLPPQHPALATGLHNFASLKMDMGDFEAAKPLFERAFDIRLARLGPDNPETLITRSSQGELCQKQGDYAQAESIFQEVLERREKKLGMNHPDTAKSINDLAFLYNEKGDYVRAERMYQRAQTIREGLPEHPDTAAVLTNLAALYESLGDYDRAEPLYQKALALQEKFLPSGHPAIANTLNDLASLYKCKGDYAPAIVLYKRALTIREKALGPDHPDVAATLNNLALLYESLGEHTTSEPLYQKALAISEKAFGPRHPSTAVHLNNFAGLYMATGDYTRAESLYRRAIEIDENALGPDHAQTASALSNLATLHWSEGEFESAARMFLRSSDIFEHNLQLIIASGSEQHKQAYLASVQYQDDLHISLHMRYAPDLPDALHLAVRTILQRKGRLLEAVAAGTNALRQRLAPGDRQLLSELMRVRTLLSNLILHGPGPRDLAAYKDEILQLQAKDDELGATISARSAEFAAASQSVTLERLQAALPLGTALVELAQYHPFHPQRSEQLHEPPEPPRYAAYVLFHEGEPGWADLGEAEPIDRLTQQFRLSLSKPDSYEHKELGRQLDEQVMTPIRKLLGDTRQVFLSPDGQLNLVPFSALVDEHGRYLGESYTFTYLGSGRDLMRLQVPVAGRQGPRVLADPDYEGTANVQAAGIPPYEKPRSADFAIQFGRLAGTAQEAEALQRLLSLSSDSVLTGERATERALKSVTGPRLLHIATHGFFLADQPPGPTVSRTFVNPNLDDLAHPVIPRHENPLLRSGLALAGANRRESGGEDGIVTALEISGLDLWGTQLVVLSACETGVGDVRNGEGVYGLRRALVLAGSRTQVISLWKVSDPATKELMEAYYQRLIKGQGRSEALLSVQREMLTGTRWNHPYYWAAFIVSGESGPLP